MAIPRTKPLKVPPLRVIDLAYDYDKYGIMFKLKTKYSALPWSITTPNEHLYDKQYTIHSGNKFLNTYSAYLADNNRFDELIDYIYGIYGPKWIRSYPLIGEDEAPYDPLIDTKTERDIDESIDTTTERSLTQEKERNTANDALLSERDRKSSQDIEHFASVDDSNELEKLKTKNTSKNSSAVIENNNSHTVEDDTEFVNEDVYGFNSGDTPVNAKDTHTDNDNDHTTIEVNTSKSDNDGFREGESDSNKGSHTTVKRDNEHSNISDNIKSVSNTDKSILNEKTTDDEDIDVGTSRDVDDDVKGLKSHTYQELAKQELELMLESYFCMVFDDLDRLICNPHYRAIF